MPDLVVPLSPPFAAGPPRRWVMVLVLAVATVAFLPTLGGGFLADDFVYIKRFSDLPWSEWPRLFTHEWSGGVWGQPLREVRPFAALSFMVDARWFGSSPLGYRLTNLGLHLLATLLVTQLAWYYGRGRAAPALIAGLIFGLHPAHVEAVAWITGRVDLLATAAALLYWLVAEFFSARGGRAYLALAFGSLFVGLFSKEFCAFVPLLLLVRWLLLDLRAPRPEWLRRGVVLGGSVLLIVVYAVCRRAALGHDSIGYNVWTDEPAWHRQASYAGWLVPLLPFTPHAEWKSFPSLAVLHGAWAVLAGAIVLGLAWALRRRARTAATALFFGGVWYLLTVTPLTGVVYHSPRHLYFATTGLAIALGISLVATRLRWVAASLLVAWALAGHIAAIRPWQQAARASHAALAAVDREIALAGVDAVVVASVPATIGPAWLWPWSSPQCFEPPFVAHPPARIIEHPVNYSRSSSWSETRQPLETVRSARAIVALWVDADGSVYCRRLSPAEVSASRDSFALTLARGLNPESWTEWVKSLARP